LISQRNQNENPRARETEYMAINPILAGEIQMAYTTAIRLDRKVPDDLVEQVPPPQAGPTLPPAKAIDVTMSDAQAIMKMAQTNATLLKVSGEEDALIRLVITPPPVHFDWAIEIVPKGPDKAVSLGLSAGKPVPK
jgi:hypothetical protein